ncbi:MAG: DUF368 domain-containing protein [Propionibacteriaceae bacterium]|nr:DUF368 domain-containing protein [Propionibacteriaceae bacterium]
MTAATIPASESTESLDLPENSPRAAVPQVARGFVLGAVDLVPGVSGGTAALVLGIYRHLIASLHHCAKTVTRVLRGDLPAAKQGVRMIPAWWLGGLGVGIVTMVFLLAGPLEYALTNHPVALAGLFFGLIVAAVILCWRQLYSTTPLTFALVGVAAVATFFLLGLSPASSGAATEPPALWVYFGAGAIAICAMILPGISGSFLLVLMGMYAHVLAAVATRDFLVLGVFVLGAATGLALAASGLNWLLHRYHDLVLAAMIGLMVGSIRLLWPWPSGLGGTELALPSAATIGMPVLLGLAGFTLVLGADLLARKVRSSDPGVELA